MDSVSKLTGFVASGSVSWMPLPFPDWRGGACSDWRHEKAVFAVDFQRVNAECGIGRSFETCCVSSTRSSTHQLIDQDGALCSLGVNELVQTSGHGAYVGAAFTNFVRNPRGEGAINGDISVGGSLPTYWSTNTGGLSLEVIGRGTYPLPFVDLHFSGIATATLFSLFFEANSHALAVAGESWGMDFWACYPESPLAAPDQISLALQTSNSSGVLQNTLSQPAIIDDQFKRHELKGVLAHASTYAVRPAVIFGLTNGASYDFVLRLAVPKMCKLDAVEGAELATNGTFLFDAAGWTTENTILVATEGVARMSAFGVNPNACQSVMTVSGSVYKFRASCNVVINTGTVIPRLFSGSLTNVVTGSIFGGASTGEVILSGCIQANSSSTNFYFGAGGSQSVSGVFDWGDVSVRRVYAGYMPEYPILPAEGVLMNTVRAADSVLAVKDGAQPFGEWTAAGLSTGFSVLSELDLAAIAHATEREIISIGSNHENVCRIAIMTSGEVCAASIFRGDEIREVVSSDALSASGIVRVAANFGAHGIELFVTKLGMEAVDIEGVIPIADTFRIGASIDGTLYLNDFIRQIQVCQPLTSSEALDWVG